MTDFRGEVAVYYAKYRRGYPSELLDQLQAAFLLDADDTVLDLGCGTGQLSLPFTSRVRSVIGMDPEPDMLRLARQAAAAQNIRNATWVLGADTDVPALGALLGRRSLAMAVVGQALHWMRHEALFRALGPLLRTGGGIAVISNGTPLWLQDSDWSRALRTFLERHFGRRLEGTCGTSPDDRLDYAEALRGSGFHDVREIVVEYRAELDLDHLVGGLYSAFPSDELPSPDERPALTERIAESLPPNRPFIEDVRVIALVGRTA